MRLTGKWRSVVVRGCVTACLVIAAPSPGWAHGDTGSGARGGGPLEVPAVRDFIGEMVRRHRFEAHALEALFAGAKFSDRVVEAFSRPAEAKPWRSYRKLFLTSRRIRNGAAFMSANRSILERASRQFGVPPEILTAIIGVESSYGEHRSRLRVLDSLATLAFRVPRRAAFFRGELEAFLLLCREERMDPSEVRGSYAGAIGMAQFIPSSYRAYAVDYDGDGRRDLRGSIADAVGSVANYLGRHRWRNGGPVAVAVVGVAAGDPRLARRGLEPRLRVSDLVRSGVKSLQAALPGGRVVMFSLDGESGTEFWLGYRNFYVLTRYNPSKLYAMAVYSLANAIRDFEPS